MDKSHKEVTVTLWGEEAEKIIDLNDPDGTQPPALPVAVVVQFDVYKGPSFLAHHARTVPIAQHTFRWMKGDKVCSRTQIPLCLSFAITIHKSQGWTRQKVCLDIGRNEHALGIAYVGCSRVTSLQGLCLQSDDPHAFSWKRFQKVNIAKGHHDRKAVDKALLRMHATLEHENHQAWVNYIRHANENTYGTPTRNNNCDLRSRKCDICATSPFRARSLPAHGHLTSVTLLLYCSLCDVWANRQRNSGYLIMSLSQCQLLSLV